MAKNGTITMSMREIDRLKVIQAVIDGNLRVSTAAERLALTKRQVNRLVRRYRAEGATGLVSHQRGQPGTGNCRQTSCRRQVLERSSHY